MILSQAREEASIRWRDGDCTSSANEGFRRAGGASSFIAPFCDAELVDVEAHRALRCPPGLEVKYFALDRGGAEEYADLARIAFGEGPSTIVRSSVRKTLIEATMLVIVDSGIRTAVLPDHLLPSLKAPVIVGRFARHA